MKDSECCIAAIEAALTEFPVIEPAHFWIGVCKAVGVETEDFKTQEKRQMDGRPVAGE